MKMTVKEILKSAFRLEDDTADQAEIRNRIVSGGQVTGSNMCVLVLAIFIASIGLNMNSTAVIIGAMLISPLMGSIVAMGYGIATVNFEFARKSLIGFLFQIAICLLTSTIYFALSPISTTTSELLARTRPTIWDVLIAVCGGLAGIIGTTRIEKSNVIPGVAIATALMPPLCTCGYAIANGQWRMLFGAGYLFLVNTYFILLSSAIVLVILKVPKKVEFKLKPELWKKLKLKIIRNTLFLLIPSLFFAHAMVVDANADATSVTGFMKNINLVEINNEVMKLFPDVAGVKVQTEETVDDDGKTVMERVVLVETKENMPEVRKTLLEDWVKTVCPDDCTIKIIDKSK